MRISIVFHANMCFLNPKTSWVTGTGRVTAPSGAVTITVTITWSYRYLPLTITSLLPLLPLPTLTPTLTTAYAYPYLRQPYRYHSSLPAPVHLCPFYIKMT